MSEKLSEPLEFAPTKNKEKFVSLIELCELPRQSTCFQMVFVLNMFHREQDGGVAQYYPCATTNRRYFDAASIRAYMPNHKTASNFTKGFSALMDGGFIERLVVDPQGQIIFESTFRRSLVTMYYRLTEKGLNLFE